MRLLVLGDLHFPFHSRRALGRVYRLLDKLKPSHVVQVGDLYDQFAFSRFPKLLRVSPDRELADARACAEVMWNNFRGLACYQLMGNHDDRALKRALAVVPEFASLVGGSLREFYSFPGVKTVNTSNEELVLGGIYLHHGHRAKLGDHARFNQEKTVVGHTHVGGVVFFPRRNKILWELNAGFLADVRSYAFNYRAQKLCHTSTLGVGWVDDLGPRFIPLDK